MKIGQHSSAEVESLAPHSPAPRFTHELRRLLMPWSFAVMLPMPMLLVMADESNSDIATLYLGLGNAWLAAEAFQPAHAPRSVAQWRRRLAALLIYLAASGLLFAVLGTVVGVRSNIPLSVLAGLGLPTLRTTHRPAVAG